MDKARAVEHFLYYLAHHPALSGLNRPTVLLGHTERYDAIAQAITHGSAAASTSNCNAWTWRPATPWHRPFKPVTCTCFSTIPPRCPTHAPKAGLYPRPARRDGRTLEEIPAVQGLRRLFLRHLQRRAPTHRRPQRHADPAHGPGQRAELYRQTRFAPGSADEQHQEVDQYQRRRQPRPGPGEIATHSEAINGQVRFVGTFLSTIPFARNTACCNHRWSYGSKTPPFAAWPVRCRGWRMISTST